MAFLLHNMVKKTLATCIAEQTGQELPAVYNALVTPPDLQMGHLAFGCFQLAKELKKAPPQIAQELAKKIPTHPLIQKAEAVGPYLNFFLKSEALSQMILPSMNDKSFFKQKLTEKTPKTMIEYSQPNTHKELHVGHMRNLCLGDALIRLHRYCGYEIVSTTFPGDVGTHVAKCLWYLKFHNKETPPKERKGAWLGTLYTKGNNLLEDQRGTPDEEKNREELTKILKQLHAKKGEYFDLWKETREWSIELMQEVYAWADVKFDVWYWESEVDEASVSLVQKYFDQGLFVKDQGAIGADLNPEKLGFCLLIKTDGTGLYATKDIELARRKFQDFKIEKNIYIVDKRQELHFKQVFKILEKMGFPQAKDCFHLKYDFVELPDGAMSSRKGNIVPLQALIDQMLEMIKVQYLNKYKGQWSDEEIENTAQIVAKGAIKFGMNRIDPAKKIVFDMAEWLKLDGESGPYVQYVYARIQSLIQKNGPDIISKKIEHKLLTHPIEVEILLKLSSFHSVVEQSTEQYKTSTLCTFLYELGKLFNNFYVACPIGKAENEELKQARLALSNAVATCLKHGLELLGIQTPSRM